MRLASNEDSRVQSSMRERTLTAQRIGLELRSLIERCEDSAAAAAEGMDDSEQLPDVWQLAYKAAMALAKSAAVDELLGNAATSARAYHKVGNSMLAAKWMQCRCLLPGVWQLVYKAATALGKPAAMPQLLGRSSISVPTSHRLVMPCWLSSRWQQRVE